jgi:hypothetical protein
MGALHGLKPYFFKIQLSLLFQLRLDLPSGLFPYSFPTKCYIHACYVSASLISSSWMFLQLRYLLSWVARSKSCHFLFSLLSAALQFMVIAFCQLMSGAQLLRHDAVGIQSVAFISATEAKVTRGHCSAYLLTLIPQPAARRRHSRKTRCRWCTYAVRKKLMAWWLFPI